MSIVMTTYAGRQRATALAVWGTVGSMGIAAGVLFGGMLTSAFDWRAVFFINVPDRRRRRWSASCARRRPRPRATGARLRGLDVPGAVTLVGGLLALVYAVECTSSHGWTSPDPGQRRRCRGAAGRVRRHRAQGRRTRSSRPPPGGSGRWSRPPS